MMLLYDFVLFRNNISSAALTFNFCSAEQKKTSFVKKEKFSAQQHVGLLWHIVVLLLLFADVE